MACSYVRTFFCLAPTKDQISSHSTRYATKASGVRTFERKLMKGIVIDDCLAIRFKKLGEDNYSRGHYTKQVEEFRSQQVLDGIDAAHHLELGYVLNGFATEISEVRVVCPSGRGTAWSSTLNQSGMQPVVVDLLPQDKGPGGNHQTEEHRRCDPHPKEDR